MQKGAGGILFHNLLQTYYKKHAIRPASAAAAIDSRKPPCGVPLGGTPSIAVPSTNCMNVTCQMTYMGIAYFSTSQ